MPLCDAGDVQIGLCLVPPTVGPNLGRKDAQRLKFPFFKKIPSGFMRVMGQLPGDRSKLSGNVSNHLDLFMDRQKERRESIL